MNRLHLSKALQTIKNNNVNLDEFRSFTTAITQVELIYSTPKHITGPFISTTRCFCSTNRHQSSQLKLPSPNGTLEIIGCSLQQPWSVSGAFWYIPKDLTRQWKKTSVMKMFLLFKTPNNFTVILSFQGCVPTLLRDLLFHCHVRGLGGVYLKSTQSPGCWPSKFLEKITLQKRCPVKNEKKKTHLS